MFKLDPMQSYMMPAHFGPRYIGEKTSGWYRDVTAMTLSYRTDREKLAAYLPNNVTVAEDAIVSVFYACNKQVDWLAGRGYNMIGVTAAVVYQGEEGPIEGSYSLVIWENLTDPILSGRELQGIPKVYADIPEHSIDQGKWSCTASHFDSTIVDLSVSNLVAVDAEQVTASQKDNVDKDNPMGWRYLPALGGFGPEVVNEITTYPSENIFTEVSVGEGQIDWHQLTWEQNPTQFHIVNALADLPMLENLPAIVTKGSTNLMVPERWTRTLR
ncbi:acetoacetate decarboxylase family protein [Oceanicoccus sagamiensis]|uniref:Acetoacetate decarboxylase n=1 Tax=Oceanicoccus sagamiensis TaxID=716816 RepID=A0A1X9NB55_9GAMM|nr:acetoacetate decarboxylase family protein [Oceanicoccus sagamiensis]ARN75268.1 acetoacetate decarboxylase [Oceanicoccus sagamiensis]